MKNCLYKHMFLLIELFYINVCIYLSVCVCVQVYAWIGLNNPYQRSAYKLQNQTSCIPCAGTQQLLYNPQASSSSSSLSSYHPCNYYFKAEILCTTLSKAVISIHSLHTLCPGGFERAFADISHTIKRHYYLSVKLK